MCVCSINLNLFLLYIHLPNICLYNLQKNRFVYGIFLRKLFFNQEMKVVTMLSFVTATLYSMYTYMYSRVVNRSNQLYLHTVKYKTRLFFVSILALLTAILAYSSEQLHGVILNKDSITEFVSCHVR